MASTLGAALPVMAQPNDPAAPIRILDDGLLQIMHAGAKTPFAEREQMLAPAVQAAFDLPQILKTSVGPRWSALPAPEQTELMTVFLRYTLASYVANFNNFSGEKFVVRPATRSVGSDRVVETQIVPADGDPTRIDYVMRATNTGWKAIDVLLDGSISRVAVQRSDFRSLLGSGNASALISSLRTKTANLEAGR
jgi:phospholipid transport system substrate-binding protein